MPRKDVVSRKMPITASIIQCVDLDRGILVTKELLTKGRPTDRKAHERKLDRICERKGYRFVQLISYKTEERTGIMPVEEFIERCTWA